MAATWTHQDLGEFEYEIEWTKPVSMPAFAAFTYDRFERHDPSDNTVPLTFDADDEEDTPTDAAAQLASRVVANQNELAKKVLNALWDDFNGRGPRSGMWWHNHLDEVVGVVEDVGLPAPAKADDLAALLLLQEIRIRRDVLDNEQPIAELSFAAAFEEEHGVGILTDGQSVLGTGYSADVTPF